MSVNQKLLLLILKLSEINDNKKIIGLFIKEISEIFPAAEFYFIGGRKKGTRRTIEVSTRNNMYGFIRIKNDRSFIEEDEALTAYAIKLLIVIMERNENQKGSIELSELRNASVNLIEDLSDEIERRNSYEKILAESEERYRLIMDNSYDAILLTKPDGSVLTVNKAACKMFLMTEEEILKCGRNALLDTSDPMLPVLLKKRDIEGGVKGELTLIRKDGTKFTAELTSSVFRDSKGEERTSMIIRDVSDRKLSEEKIKLLNSRLHFLIQTLNVLNSAKSVEEIKKIVLTSSRKLINSDGCNFVLLEGDLCIYAHEDPVSSVMVETTIPVDSCLSGKVITKGETVIIPDIYSDDRVNIEPYKSVPPKSIMVVPINKSEPFGAIENYWNIKKTPTEEEVKLIETLANETTSIYKNLKIFEELEMRVNEKTTELQDQVSELERFRKATINRELRMKELRNEIERLKH